MKNLAVIPARGGSKRIPRKNIKEFLGKPIIVYSIEAAQKSELFDEIMVSTDDAEIAEVALKYGASIPFIRPKELADDYTGTADVSRHAIKYLENKGKEYDFVCTIYATAPLIKKEYLIEGFKRLSRSNAIFAFSATSMPFPIQRTFKINKNGRCEMFWPENFNKRSQDLDEAFQDAGQFYWEKVKYVSEENYFGKDSIPIIIPRYLVQDIDTLEDWKRAELLYKIFNDNTK